MTDYTDLQATDEEANESSTMSTVDPDLHYNLQANDEIGAESVTVYGPRLVQRVYDLAAGRWAYFEDDKPNPSPGLSQTSPPHTGSIAKHQVLYETIPVYAPPPPALKGSDELLYVDTQGDPAPIQRTFRIPMSDFASELEPSGKFAWNLRGNGMIEKGNEYDHIPCWLHDSSSLDDSVAVYVEVPLPAGSQLVRVSAEVHAWGDLRSPPNWIQLSAGQTAREGDTLYHRTDEISTPQPQSVGKQLLTVTRAGDLPWMQPFDTSDKLVLIRLTGLGDVGMYWVEVTYLDPGPKNRGAT